MIKFYSDDDAKKTKLEGKKLQSRGVVIDGKYVLIENESADLERDSDEKDRLDEIALTDEEALEEEKERKKMELLAAQKQQELIKKQMQQAGALDLTQGEQQNKIRDGIKLSQNKGEPVRNKDGTENNVIEREKKEASQEKILDVTAAKFLVGDNTEKLLINKENVDVNKLTPEQAENLKNAVPAGNLRDKPGRGFGLDV